MSRRFIAIPFFVAALAVFVFAAQTATVQAAPPVQTPTGDAGRGAYIFSATSGCGCHIGPAGFLAGGQEYKGPFGEVYARNITSDPETGIGTWTEADIVKAIRTGKSKDGHQLFPIMPYHTFSGMADQDAYDLAAFIKMAPPIKNQVPATHVNFPVPPFNPPTAPATAPTAGVERGKYLVNAVSDCSGCHTPTDAQGNPDMSKFLAGSFVEGQVSSNITPDKETGIGNWTEDQIANLLKTGKRPDGSEVTGAMLRVVQSGFSQMTDADRAAIASYLKTIPAVNNVPQAPVPLPATGTNPINNPLLAGLLVAGAVLMLGGVVAWRSARRGK